MADQDTVARFMSLDSTASTLRAEWNNKRRDSPRQLRNQSNAIGDIMSRSQAFGASGLPLEALLAYVEMAWLVGQHPELRAYLRRPGTRAPDA